MMMMMIKSAAARSQMSAPKALSLSVAASAAVRGDGQGEIRAAFQGFPPPDKLCVASTTSLIKLGYFQRILAVGCRRTSRVSDSPLLKQQAIGHDRR